MKIPDNLFYTKEHEWLKIDGDIAIVGISDFAQSELGDIVFVELPEINDNFSKDDVFGTIEAIKTVADLYSPISGEVVAINENIESSPETVNKEPYDNGWIIKLKIDNKDEIDTLLSPSEYKELIS
tara:strand:+ start:194 stop:571 length:378 start_codon:yes stop_codon:yes gene_type:complete